MLNEHAKHVAIFGLQKSTKTLLKIQSTRRNIEQGDVHEVQFSVTKTWAKVPFLDTPLQTTNEGDIQMSEIDTLIQTAENQRTTLIES